MQNARGARHSERRAASSNATDGGGIASCSAIFTQTRLHRMVACHIFVSSVSSVSSILRASSVPRTRPAEQSRRSCGLGAVTPFLPHGVAQPLAPSQRCGHLRPRRDSVRRSPTSVSMRRGPCRRRPRRAFQGQLERDERQRRMSAAPPLGLPKMIGDVGRSVRPAPAAAADWSIVAKTVFPAATIALERRPTASGYGKVLCLTLASHPLPDA